MALLNFILEFLAVLFWLLTVIFQIGALVFVSIYWREINLPGFPRLIYYAVWIYYGPVYFYKNFRARLKEKLLYKALKSRLPVWRVRFPETRETFIFVDGEKFIETLERETIDLHGERPLKEAVDENGVLCFKFEPYHDQDFEDVLKTLKSLQYE